MARTAWVLRKQRSDVVDHVEPDAKGRTRANARQLPDSAVRKIRTNIIPPVKEQREMNIIEDWESQDHMDPGKTVAYFAGIIDDDADRLSKAFSLLSCSSGAVRTETAKLLRALLLYIDD